MRKFLPNTNYIHSDPILEGIYNRSVKKFFDLANNQIVFKDLADYIKNQIKWKKQDLYLHGLPLLKEVCDKISEDFDNGCEFYEPNAINYRDIYFAVFD